jgi:hypothetical protein
MSAVASHVRWITSDDVTLLLDIRAGTLSALEGAASTMWTFFATGADDRTVTDAILQRFDAAPSRITEDVSAFRRHCISLGLLTAGDSAAAARGLSARAADRASTRPDASWFAKLPARLHAALSAARVRWRMRGGDLNRAYEFATRVAAGGHDAKRRTHALTQLVDAFVRGEGTLLSGGAIGDCLPRSLALYVFLSERGVQATHVIGVTPRPFAAHAWVEVDGRALCDDAERTRAFVRLAVLC